jgi:hypothetical protein
MSAQGAGTIALEDITKSVHAIRAASGFEYEEVGYGDSADILRCAMLGCILLTMSYTLEETVGCTTGRMEKLPRFALRHLRLLK